MSSGFSAEDVHLVLVEAFVGAELQLGRAILPTSNFIYFLSCCIENRRSIFTFFFRFSYFPIIDIFPIIFIRKCLEKSDGTNLEVHVRNGVPNMPAPIASFVLLEIGPPGLRKAELRAECSSSGRYPRIFLDSLTAPTAALCKGFEQVYLKG